MRRSSRLPAKYLGNVSYVNIRDAVDQCIVHYEWQHRISESVQAVIDAGLVVRRLQEGDTLDTLDWTFAPWVEAETPTAPTASPTFSGRSYRRSSPSRRTSRRTYNDGRAVESTAAVRRPAAESYALLIARCLLSGVRYEGASAVVP
jgi:hypothetical protein